MRDPLTRLFGLDTLANVASHETHFKSCVPPGFAMIAMPPLDETRSGKGLGFSEASQHSKYYWN